MVMMVVPTYAIAPAVPLAEGALIATVLVMAGLTFASTGSMDSAARSFWSDLDTGQKFCLQT
jgi:hypothetical protein